ncbi:hypothetical protein B0J13DRAFT_213524 [Dactylonectria estremocensis]|uniref:Uncharacterized protein n=1 Tax=Dactylonectria estremocensis TaxID=1079267 RepID=A0A9P9F658_9HYPO|nr:hypothetical protein B0J13DRAFT_213524 [Dactylonectria estremocensis]
MNLADSTLFKDYARPILQPEASVNKAQGHSSPGIMSSVLQCLVCPPKLEVSRIKLAYVSEDTFTMAIESRITGTGPISSTISPMVLDLTFSDFAFGKLELPEVRTSFWGAGVVVREQSITITDAATFRAFVRSIMVDDDTSFQLDNGTCSVRALGATAHYNYSLDIPIRAMRGPRATVRTLSRTSEGLAATVRLSNPSPVELDHGVCAFELRNDKGERMAELSGQLKMVRGQFDLSLHGTMRTGVAPSGKVRLVGVGEGASSWCNDFDVVLDLNNEFAGLFHA